MVADSQVVNRVPCPKESPFAGDSHIPPDPPTNVQPASAANMMILKPYRGWILYSRGIAVSSSATWPSAKFRPLICSRIIPSNWQNLRRLRNKEEMPNWHDMASSRGVHRWIQVH